MDDPKGLPASVALDLSSEVGIDLYSSRAKLAEILNTFGDKLPTDLKHIRRDGPDRAASTPEIDQTTSAGHIVAGGGEENREAGAGPSHSQQGAAPSTGDTEFEAEWARLPSAIASLSSSSKIKELVMRNIAEKTVFQRSLPVEANGIDYCYLSRPTFRQILIDLDNDELDDDEAYELAQDAGLLPSYNDYLALSEALWESHFGVPRHLEWYSAFTQYWDGVLSCTPIEFAPPDLDRFGLSPLCFNHHVDAVHFALAGAKRPLVYVGPTTGLLYAVVQGSLLLISWPSTKHNFEVWLNASRASQAMQWDQLDKFENPTINLLRTGDAVYLPCGTTNVILALSHVSMISRQVLNPTADEFVSMIRGCHRLMATYIDQQETGYSPYDEIQVDRIDGCVTEWIPIVQGLMDEKLHHEATPSQQAMQDFLRGLRQVKDQVHQYRKAVQSSLPKAQGKKARNHRRNRAVETLNSVAKLAESAQTSQQAVSLPLETLVIGVPQRYIPLGPSVKVKGKRRAPS